MRLLACLPLLAVLACQSEEGGPAPEKPEKKQLDLAGKIFSLVPEVEKLGPEAEKDAGLALAQIIVPGYAARLRHNVAEDLPGVASGAAIALVSIRLLGATAEKPVLDECAAHETIAAMREECGLRAAGNVKAMATFPEEWQYTADDMMARLSSGDPEVRRRGLRVLLNPRHPTTALPDVLNGKLLPLMSDADPRIKVMTAAVFLRESLFRNPLPPEPK
jgi:hypothetical protein